MCGIAAIYGSNLTGKKDLLDNILNKLDHRGDKKREIKSLDGCLLGCNRLSIIDREKSIQPISNEDNSIFIVFNGEIYNYKELRNNLRNHTFKTDSDTEVLMHGYEEWDTGLLNKLDGQFAFIIYDKNNDSIFAARDHFGIKPLYYTKSEDYIAFASEIKALTDLDSDEIKIIQPGTYFLNNKINQYFKLNETAVNHNLDEIKSNIKKLFDEAVKKRVQTDLPIAVLLSGGIDSSLILKYALKYHPNVTAFCVGEKNSEDLFYARNIANNFGVKLKTFDPKNIDIKNELEKFIYVGETFEPNHINTLGLSYYISKVIHDNGIKIALAGEGSDEIFAGYSEFKSIKDKKELQSQLLRYINLLHRTQLQRVDRTSMAHQVEVRVPFLDKKLVEYAMSIDPLLKIKKNQTKWILREAFRDELPDYIIERKKMAFPVGASKRKEFEEDEYKRLANTLSDKEFESIQKQFPQYRLIDKEEAFYFNIYKKYFLKSKFNQERFRMRSR